MVASLVSALPAALAVLAASLPGSSAQMLQVDTREHILESARTLASDLMALYKGNQTGETPGLLSGPPPLGDYYWWQGAAFAGTYIDYWRLTGDATYNAVITQALLHQTGSNANFMPANWTASMSNDDQCLWGSSALLAAESGFPNPPQDQPQWLALAQAVFENQVARLQTETACNGGLRWQIMPTNVGYTYKSVMPNACFVNLGARLARFTGNQTYASFAGQTWDWLQGVGLLDRDTWAVYDGAHADKNCSDINRIQFSYSAAILTEGAAFMYNVTNSDLWRERTEKLTEALLKTFFSAGVAVEVACEKAGTCTSDMRSFKGLAHRWLAATTQVAPFVAAKILPVLRTSAQAAVEKCTGGTSGRACSFSWAEGANGSLTGAGEQMNALAAVSSMLVSGAAAPGTNSTPAGSGPVSGGGTGTGNGGGDGGRPNAAGRAGTCMLGVVLGLGAWGFTVML